MNPPAGTTFTTPEQEPRDYLEVLHLQREPFGDIVDDRFFYPDPLLLQRLDLMQHLVRFGDLVLVVTGEPGIGKTTLLQQLLIRAGDQWRVCCPHVSDIQDGATLLQHLARCFGLDAQGAPEALRQRLLEYGRQLLAAGQAAVVIIDDADRLPRAVLEQLLAIGGNPAETARALRIVLFGVPGLAGELIGLTGHSARNPVLHTMEVPHLDEAQSAAYLMYRLAAAGYSGDSPFSRTELAAIHKAADGVPARLNQLAHETLTEQVQRNSRLARLGELRSGSGQPMLRTWLTPARLGILVAMLLAVTLLWFQQPINRLFQAEPPPAAEADTLPEPAPAAPPAAAIAPPADAPVTASPETEPTPLPEPPPVAADEAGTPATHEAPPAAIPEPPEPAPPASAEPEPAAPEQVAPPPPEAPRPANETAQALPADGASVTAASGTPPPAAAPATEAAAAKAPAPTAPSRPPAGEAGGPEWLLAQPPGHYTLQLLAVTNPAGIERFIRQHGLEGPLASYRTRRKGRDWYFLVQGSYPTRAAALAAVRKLPAGVRRNGPWARELAAVQAEIRAVSPQ